MKKILKNTLVTVFSLAVFFGCEKNFDPKIYGVLTDQNFPMTEADCESFAMTCYIPYVNTFSYSLYATQGNQHPWYIPAGGVLKMFDTTSDLVAPWINAPWHKDYRLLSQADFSNCPYYVREPMQDVMPNNYPKTREITRFTSVIQTLETVSSSILSDKRRAELLGEARTCRGLHMYNLLHVYGPVPVIVNTSDLTNSAALNNPVRPTLEQMAKWIYDDLSYGAKNAPETQSVKGRFTRDFARVMLMRHCLNEGYHQEGWYQVALDMYEELNTGKYRLFTTGNNPYKEMFREVNDFNCEIIGAISCDPSSTGNPKEGGMNPFAMLAMPNNAAKKDDKGDPTPFAVCGPGWGMTFNLSPAFYNTFEPGDRRAECIITRYYTTGGEWWGPEQIGRKPEWDGYIPYKYPAETATAPCWGNDFPLARWADVLLMFAEAEVRNSGAAPSEEAIKAVNEVRDRAGLSDLSASKTSSAEAFLNAILDERGHELWFEGMRKIDLIRFNQYAQRVVNIKGCLPTHQYMPIPNYAVDEAAAIGKTLEQVFSREGWIEDQNKAIGE